LRLAFGSEKSEVEIRRIGRDVFKNLGNLLFEIGWMIRLKPKQFGHYFEVNGWQNYHYAMKNGKGTLVLTAHMGNWESLPVISALSSHPVNIVYRPIDSAVLNRFFEISRSRFGARMIPAKRSKRAMSKIVKRLYNGECVAMLMDQSVNYKKGVIVDFFERAIPTNNGMALIARKTRSPVVPLFCARTEKGFLLEFGGQIPFTETGDKVKDIEINTQAYNDAIESFIRRFPAQWFWVHRRWKRAPYCPWPRLIEKPVKSDTVPEMRH
jgi:KDO2-lipid IV(A) lauroyltransferase